MLESQLCLLIKFLERHKRHKGTFVQHATISGTDFRKCNIVSLPASALIPYHKKVPVWWYKVSGVYQLPCFFQVSFIHRNDVGRGEARQMPAGISHHFL